MKLPPLLSLRDLLRLYGVHATKSLSQNFILDTALLGKLVSYCPNLQQRPVLEIGPGPGGLTRALLNAGVQRLVTVERDARFVPVLQMLEQASDGRMRSVIGDIMPTDEYELLQAHFGPLPDASDSLVDAPMLVGNLPFQISTALLLKWLRQMAVGQGIFRLGHVGMALMFQKEVAERLVALHGTRQYGRISIMTQHLCHVRLAHVLPRTCFTPRPKVDAAWVLLQPRAEPLTDTPTAFVEQFTTLAFSKSRKTAARGLEASGVPSALVDILLNSEGLSGKERFQSLPVDTICRMANVWGQNRHLMQTDPYFAQKGKPKLPLSKASEEMVAMFEKNCDSDAAPP